eukprot:gnl/TRDRNA2_/TRDRNA2_194404_c0_seq1.p1 gnl/TRDRNA2_/TRDRNA2_194404_c0~~gnl/TRDRNA2_/TRDRNA2_194404_c0_seq1.p1  ORF type:complete len:509 (-),score=88.90 gnl/TRDRNA2_/TRDRNA2_194404_c0_seq1:22-1548(-)
MAAVMAAELPPVPSVAPIPESVPLPLHFGRKKSASERPIEAHSPVTASSPLPPHFGRRGRPTEQLQGPKVGIVCSGTRGDIQPFVALAQALQDLDLCVTMFTNWNFLAFCNTAGVDAVATFACSESVILDGGGVVAGPVMNRGSDGAACDGQSFEEWACNMCRHDEIVSSPSANTAVRDWLEAHPGLVTKPDKAIAEFRPTVVLFQFMTQIVAAKIEKELGILTIPVYFNGGLGSLLTKRRPPRPALYALSPTLDPKVQHFCSEAWDHATGQWILQEELSDDSLAGQHPQLDALRRFIAGGNGAQLVAIGWGSITPQVFSPTKMLKLALRALKHAGRRGVIIGGWARLHEVGEALLRGELRGNWGGDDHDSLRAFAQASVFFIESTPHAWLYQQCSCAVHHGGAGVTHTALLASCPSVVTPIFADQFYFSNCIIKLKAGKGFCRPLSEIKAHELATAIKKAEAMKPSKSVVAGMREEKGAAAAALIIKEFIGTLSQRETDSQHTSAAV